LHGYTSVGKGTTAENIERLKLEGRVYRHLEARQGRDIPVYLGNIELHVPWTGPGIDIIYMLLMSWAGECVHRNVACDRQGLRRVDEAANEFITECPQVGACHRDNIYERILWNAERGQMMFIDFDLTILFNPLQPPPKVLEIYGDRYRPGFVLP
ncbi:MAG: hypothetical protein Q9219_007406, partial [cf. Caloplaca sp. 3 TL-2023]